MYACWELIWIIFFFQKRRQLASYFWPFSSSAVVYGRRPWNCQRPSPPTHIHPHEPLHKTMLLFTLAPQTACQTSMKAIFVLSQSCTVMIVEKKSTRKSRNSALLLFPNFISITLRRDFCLHDRLLPSSSLKYSVCFCLLFKIITTSVAETTTRSCSYGSSAQVPWEAFIFF